MGRTGNTMDAEKDAMLLWLSNDSNFKLITGASTQNKAVVAGKPTKKIDGFRKRQKQQMMTR